MNFYERSNYRMDSHMSSNGLFTVIERKPLSSLENSENMNMSSLGNSLSTSNTTSPPKRNGYGQTDSICGLYRLNTSQLSNDNLDISTGGKINFVDDDVSSFDDSEKDGDDIFLDDDISTLDSNYSMSNPSKNSSPRKMRGSVFLNNNNNNNNNNNRNRSTPHFYDNLRDDINGDEMFSSGNRSDFSNDELYTNTKSGEKAVRLNKNIYRIDNVIYDEQSRKEHVINKVKQIRNSMISEPDSEGGSDIRLKKNLQDERRDIWKKGGNKTSFDMSRKNDPNYNTFDDISRYNSDGKIKYRKEQKRTDVGAGTARFADHELNQYGHIHDRFQNEHSREEENEENDKGDKHDRTFFYAQRKAEDYKDATRKSYMDMKGLDYQKNGRMDRYGMEKGNRKERFENGNEKKELNELSEEEDELDSKLKRTASKRGNLPFDDKRKSKINIEQNGMHRTSRRDIDKFYMDENGQTYIDKRYENEHLDYYNKQDGYYEGVHRRTQNDKEHFVPTKYIMTHEGNYALPKKMHTGDALYKSRKEGVKEEQEMVDMHTQERFLHNEKGGEFFSKEFNVNHPVNPYFYKKKMSQEHMLHGAHKMRPNEDGSVYYKEFSKQKFNRGFNEDHLDGDVYMNNDTNETMKEKNFIPYGVRSEENMSNDVEGVHRNRNERVYIGKKEMFLNNNHAAYEPYNTRESGMGAQMMYDENGEDAQLSKYNDSLSDRNKPLHPINVNRNMVDDELFYTEENANRKPRYSADEEDRHYHYPQSSMYRKERFKEHEVYNRESYKHIQSFVPDDTIPADSSYQKNTCAHRNSDGDTPEANEEMYYYNGAHMNSSEHRGMQHYKNQRSHLYDAEAERIGEMECEEGQMINGRLITRKDSHAHFHRDDDDGDNSGYENGEPPHKYGSFKHPSNYINDVEMPQKCTKEEKEELHQQREENTEREENKEQKMDERLQENKEGVETIKDVKLQEKKETDGTVDQMELTGKAPHTPDNEIAATSNNAVLKKDQTVVETKTETTNSVPVTAVMNATTATVHLATASTPVQQTMPSTIPPIVTPPAATALPVTTPPITTVPISASPAVTTVAGTQSIATTPDGTQPVTVQPLTVQPVIAQPTTTQPITAQPFATPATVTTTIVTPPVTVPAVTPPAPAAPVKRRRGRPKVKKTGEEAQATATTTTAPTNIGTNIGAGYLANNTMMQPQLSHALTNNFGHMNTAANVALNHLNTANTILTDLNQPVYNGINANFNAGIPVNMNHLNQINQLNQLKHMDQMHQLKQIDHLNQLTQMDQLNQLNAMDPMNHHLNQQMNPAMNQQLEQLNMHMNVHPQYTKPMYNNVNPPIDHALFVMPNRMDNMNGANMQAKSNEEQYNMCNDNTSFDNEMMNNNNNNNHEERHYYGNKMNQENYPYEGEREENKTNGYMMNEDAMDGYNKNTQDEYNNYKHSNKRSTRSAVSESEGRGSQGGYTEGYHRRGRKKRREMEEQMEEDAYTYEEQQSMTLQNNDANEDSQKGDQNETSGYSTFIDENNKKASYKVAYHPADAIWEKVSGVKFGPMILTAQSRTTNVILSKKRSIELGNILHNLIYGYIYKGDNVRLTIGKESKTVMCGSAFFLPSFMDCSIHNDDDSGSAKLFLCFVYLNPSQ